MRNIGVLLIVVGYGMLACVVSEADDGVAPSTVSSDARCALEEGEKWSRTIYVPDKRMAVSRLEEQTLIFTVVSASSSGECVVEVANTAAPENDPNARFRVVMSASGQFLGFRVQRAGKWHDWQARKEIREGHVVDIVNDTTLNFSYAFLPRGVVQEGSTIEAKTSKGEPVEVTTRLKGGKLWVQCKVFKDSSKKDTVDDLDIVFGTTTPWAESGTSKKGRLRPFSGAVGPDRR